MASNDQQSAKARRAALEKEMAAKQGATKSKSKPSKGQKPTKEPKAQKTTKAPKVKEAKAENVKGPAGPLKKVTIGIAGLLALFLLGGGIFYVSIGGEYEHQTITLVPQDALLVVEIDNAASQLDALDSSLTGFYENRRSLKTLERSPFWREGADFSVEKFHKESMKQGLDSLRETLKTMPVEFTLEGDIITEKLIFAMLPGEDGMKKLMLTRVSQDFAKSWAMRGFGEGQYGETTVASQDDFLTIAKSGEPGMTYMGLFGNVLAVAWDDGVLEHVLACYDADGAGSFDALPLMNKARTSLSEIKQEGGNSPTITAFANLEAIREYQGADPEDLEGRASVDTYFSPSAQTMQLSAEIMPTVANVMEHSIDTRLYDLVAWKARISPKQGILIDQVLVADESKVSEFPRVETAMKTPAEEASYLKLLPQGTWMIGTMRQPLSEVSKAAKPNDDGKAGPIYKFMKALGGEATAPDSIGLAMLPARFSPMKTNDTRPREAKSPPKVVSKLPFPPFALFLHWPNVDHEQVKKLLQTVIDQVVAEQKDPKKPNEKPVTRIQERTVHGVKYVEIFNGPKHVSSDQGWLNNIAAVAIGDHLIFTYAGLDGRRKYDPAGTTGVNSAVAYMVGITKGVKEHVSLRDQEAAQPIWQATGLNHNALVHFSSRGLRSFSMESGLPKLMSEAKFDGEAPDGMTAVDFRKVIAKEIGKDWKTHEVTLEFRKRIAKWRSEEPMYAREVGLNIDASEVLQDFTAMTTTTPSTMHTRFFLRLGK